MTREFASFSERFLKILIDWKIIVFSSPMKHTSTSPRGMAMFGGPPDRKCLLVATSCGNASSSRYKTISLQLSLQWNRTQQKALDDTDGDDAASQGKSTFRSKLMYTDRLNDTHLSYIIFKSKCSRSAWRRNSSCWKVNSTTFLFSHLYSKTGSIICRILYISKQFRKQQ